MPLDEKTISQVNVLFVNPSIGNDTAGNGGENAPLRTITQALQNATPNTVIKLAPGSYTAETGEVFPLMLKSGVAIQGDAANQGQGIIIQGGGQFLSRSFGGQNVTIVGANEAQLTGVTVTNSYPRGYGLWIESTNPVITANTFTGSTQDGVAVSGKATPTITKNYFQRNGANGITISGTSQPQVRENIFVQTGFGINITDNAAPVVVGNQIQDNRAGIIVQAKARPILRQNLIQNNQEDGLVAIAQAMPDLGNATEAGGNQFQGNKRYDINASAAKQSIVAVGNTINTERVAGSVSFQAQTPTSANTEQVAANGEIIFAAPGVSDQPIVQQQTQAPLILPKYNQQLPPPNSQRVTNRSSTRKTSPATTRKATPLPAVPAQATQFNYVQIDTNTIEFVAPETQTPSTTVTTQSSPANLSPTQSQVNPQPSNPGAVSNNNDLLPVPDGDIPLGNTRNMQKVSAPPTNTTSYAGNYSSSPAPGVRYRVVVEALTDREQELVKNLAPGAFPTIWQSRRVMQVGVFSDRNNANEMLKILTNNGLRTIIEPLN
jgi:parallel beta-helix repeat protein